MNIELYQHQIESIDKLENGSILCGGVGSGKSRTALMYYFVKECKGEIKVNGEGKFKKMKKPKDLYIITTARKRDTLEWEHETSSFLIGRKQEDNIQNVKLTVDSWNNIDKYIDVEDAFFIFDEQRVVGYGLWAKSFIKIARKNRWILLTATPGDTWMDYVPVFIANNFYKHKTEFVRRHVVYNRFTKYPKVDHYVECGRLEKFRRKISVNMKYEKRTIRHNKEIFVPYDKTKEKVVLNKRWNIFTKEPAKDIAEICRVLRRLVSSDYRRVEALLDILVDRPKVIVFYNYNYELDILREMVEDLGITKAEWNGHKHEPIPDTDKWVYLVQYTAGAEGWNCVETDTIIFYSQNYSYKLMEQARGRIDRINSPFIHLYYYHLISHSQIDRGIKKALLKKKNFNENKFIK